MSTPRKKHLVPAIALACTAILATPIARRLIGPRIPRFYYAFGELSPSDKRELLADPAWQLRSIQVEPALSLPALVRRPKNPDAPWLFYFSGNDASPLRTAQTFLERARGDRDWGLATWAYRGTASTGATPSRDALVRDAQAVLSQLRQDERIPEARAHLVAFSLGGYLAAKVAGTAALANERFASLALLAAGAHIEMVLPTFTQRWLLGGEEYEIGPLLDAVPAPVLVVQGTADEAVPVAQGRGIAARLGRRAHYLELNGVGHTAVLEQEATLQALRDQIERRAP